MHPITQQQGSQLGAYTDICNLHSQARESGIKEAKQRKIKMKQLDKVGMMTNKDWGWQDLYDVDMEEVEEVELICLDLGGFDGDIIWLEHISFGCSHVNSIHHKLELNN